MDKRDWKPFCGLIRAADEMTVGKTRSAAALSLMFNALSAYRLEAVQVAVAAHIGKCKFVVTPADIVTLIEGSDEDRSLEAWRVFLQALDRYGYYDSVRFPHPAYHYAIQRLGGWERLSEEFRDLSDREVQFRAKDWRRLYEIGLRSATWDHCKAGKEIVPVYLWGFWERDNREKGRLDFLPEVIDVGLALGMTPPPALGDGGQIAVMPEAEETEVEAS